MTTSRRSIITGVLGGLLASVVGARPSSAQTDVGPALFIGTHAADDHDRATFPFLLARGVVRAGQPAAILLMGDGTRLLQPGVTASIEAAGPQPLREIVPDLAGVPLFVCMGCGRARGVTDDDVAAAGGQWVANPEVESLIANASRVASF
jgi:predicted peroxiredoxin